MFIDFSTCNISKRLSFPESYFYDHVGYETGSVLKEYHKKTFAGFLCRIGYRKVAINFIAIPSVVYHVSVVCDVCAPYSEGLSFCNIFALRCSLIICLDCEENSENIHNRFSAGGRLLYIKGYKKSRFSSNISLHFGNNTRYVHSYSGRWIGTRMRSVECYHFQLSWIT